MDRAADRELPRRAAVATLLVSAVVLAVLAAVLVPWSWIPGGRLTPVPAGRLFSAEELSRAHSYTDTQRTLGLVSYGVSLLVAVVLGLTPLGARLVRRVTGRLPWWASVVLATAVLLLIGRVVTLPFAGVEHHRGLAFAISTQPWGAWFLDLGKSYLVGLVTSALLLLVVVGAARRSPRYWFAWAGGLAFLLVAVGSYVYPVVVQPAFANFHSMTPGPFRSSVLALARKEGVHLDDVLVSDASTRTNTVNAYVSGFGSTRRLVVYDTLRRDLTPDQARVVIAHELGHAKHHDVLLGTLLGAVGSVGAVALLALVVESAWVRRRAGIARVGEPASVALVLAAVAVGTFLASPVQNTVSRAIEARADRASIVTTGEGGVFVQMQHQLAVHSLADPSPPAWDQLWFGTHPTTLQRAGIPASLRRAGDLSQHGDTR